MQRITLGISCGDPNGIGLEVALKAFSDKRLFKYFAPIIFASPEMVAIHQEANALSGVQTQAVSISDSAFAKTKHDELVRIVTCWEHEPPVEFGRISEEGGAVAKTSLEQAAQALHNKQIDVLVTAPIHKSAMQQAGFGYPGHTEFLENEFGRGRSLMIMVGDDDLRVAVATGHIPIKSVANSISPTILQNKIALLDDTLKRDFGINGPLIAVLGLNPHAGDGGAIGQEEQITIRPAVEAMKARGVDVMGPFPADGFFGSGQYRNFDAVLAMYHDQGLVPFKTLAFGGGVNFTAGLSVVRTSPDHGTALDIAGKGLASAASFAQACFLARRVYMSREGYDEAHADPLQFRGYGRKKRGDRTPRGNSKKDKKQPKAAIAKTAQPMNAPRAAERDVKTDAYVGGAPADAGSAKGGHPDGTPPES